jgi:hypothetical protein
MQRATCDLQHTHTFHAQPVQCFASIDRCSPIQLSRPADARFST